MAGKPWTKAEEQRLAEAYQSEGGPRHSFAKRWAHKLNRTVPAVQIKLEYMGFEGKKILPLRPSPYPSYDKPLEMHGDALVLTDIEFPFHHAEFVNRCLQLASSWGIRQLILGGDVLHFDNLSGWEPAWVGDTDSESIGSAVSDKLFEFAKTLPSKRQGELMALLGEMAEHEPEKNLTEELNIARRELRRLEQQFDKIDLVLGNHEGRLLRAMEVALSPTELLRLLEADKRWRTSPYYYSILWSGGQRFQIEHPKVTAKHSAEALAAKYGTHVIMAHSHQLAVAFDISGKFWAIESGHCVDETKLPYASQRHNKSHTHVLGAVIVRDGYPHLLTQRTEWERMEKMV